VEVLLGGGGPEEFVKKNAQNVAQPIVCKKYYITLATEKSNPKTWATIVSFQKLSKVNFHPVGENSPNLVTQVISYKS
jgi:hypothetical protein